MKIESNKKIAAVEYVITLRLSADEVRDMEQVLGELPGEPSDQPVQALYEELERLAEEIRDAS